MVSKTCTKCNLDKPLDQFYIQARGKYGRQAKCSTCSRDYAKTRYTANEKYEASIRLRYGLEPEDYAILLEAQNFSCAICKVRYTECTRRFSVDHNHITGEIRGLLCHWCNVGLGNFKDSTVNLELAIDYLKKSMPG